MKLSKYNITPLNKSEMKNINGGLGLIGIVLVVALIYGYYDEKAKMKEAA